MSEVVKEFITIKKLEDKRYRVEMETRLIFGETYKIGALERIMDFKYNKYDGRYEILPQDDEVDYATSIVIRDVILFPTFRKAFKELINNDGIEKVNFYYTRIKHNVNLETTLNNLLSDDLKILK